MNLAQKIMFPGRLRTLEGFYNGCTCLIGSTLRAAGDVSTTKNLHPKYSMLTSLSLHLAL